MLSDLPLWVFDVLFVLNRWVHVVGTTLLVGGILFFEFVVPLAVEDLKDEQRLAVFGRARWVFRKVIWVSIIGLLVSGIFAGWRMWTIYTEYDFTTGSAWLGPKPWFATHVIVAGVGMLMALRLTSGRRLLARPVRWMQGVLILLLVSIFLANIARQVRMHLRELQPWRAVTGARQVSP